MQEDEEPAAIAKRLRNGAAPARETDPQIDVEPTGDPAHQINRLPAASRPPLCVSPDTSLERVTTLMMSNDFSQLPVTTSSRHLKGVVSWKSIGSRLALKRPVATAQDCMEVVRTLRSTDSLFAAIGVIAVQDYVVIRTADKTLCGIVTASDLNEQFRLLAEPFLLVGEIESRVRHLLHDKFTQAELAAVKAPGDCRQVETVADLSFGEYIRLVECGQNWCALKIEADRVVFIEQLKRVCDIRNDVMHFDPCGLADENFQFLRRFARYLRYLRAIGAV